MNGLYEKLRDFIIGTGFEEMTLNGGTVFHKDGKFVRIVCCDSQATVELADSVHDAENNMYEDIDLYDYAYMREHGFPGDDDIFGEICADIIKYIVN